MGKVARGRRVGPLKCGDCATEDPARFRTLRAHLCDACKRARKSANGKAYHAANRERDNVRGAAWYKAHAPEILDRIRDSEREKSRRLRAERPEVARARSRRWYRKNMARAAAMSRAWRQANLEVMQRHAANRRALHAGVVRTLTAAEWRDTLALFDGACAYCLRTDRPLTQDHIVPISRGGPHSQENVVPVCGSCNSRKHDRSIFAML